MRRHIAATAVVLLYAAAPFEAQRGASHAATGSTLKLIATAYCQRGTTRSGAHTRAGIVAADPRLLPVGSVVRINTPKAYAGIYTVMDTGAAVKGRTLDIFIADCERARRFGKQPVRVSVLRRGWDPKHSEGDFR